MSLEQASSIKMGDIMNKDVLRKRFDSIHVEHLILLWNIVKESLNKHLKLCDYRVNWNCDTLDVPFKNISDASLVTLSSISKHPIDGYDYLFIIINQIIGQFNEFMHKLYKDKSASLELFLVHPRTLLSRSPTGLSLKALRLQ